METVRKQWMPEMGQDGDAGRRQGMVLMENGTLERFFYFLCCSRDHRRGEKKEEKAERERKEKKKKRGTWDNLTKDLDKEGGVGTTRC